jgi:long-chain acyl-CoA synthetase
VAPQLMENKFKESRFIEQIMVIGENQKHPAALLVPAFDFVKNWCESNNINVLDNKSLCEHDEVIAKIKSEVDFYNTHFSQWEQVKKIELIDQEFAVETGELTPTLKFKRKIILDKYKNLVAKIYN